MDARAIYESICLEQMHAQDTNEPSHFVMKNENGIMAQGFVYEDLVSLNLMTGVYLRIEFDTMELDKDANNVNADGYIYLYKTGELSRRYMGMIACDEIISFEVD